MGTFLRK